MLSKEVDGVADSKKDKYSMAKSLLMLLLTLISFTSAQIAALLPFAKS